MPAHSVSSGKASSVPARQIRWKYPPRTYCAVARMAGIESAANTTWGVSTVAGTTGRGVAKCRPLRRGKNRPPSSYRVMGRQRLSRRPTRLLVGSGFRARRRCPALGAPSRVHQKRSQQVAQKAELGRQCRDTENQPARRGGPARRVGLFVGPPYCADTILGWPSGAPLVRRGG